jgi:hypothetical protein
LRETIRAAGVLVFGARPVWHCSAAGIELHFISAEFFGASEGSLRILILQLLIAADG